MNLLTAQRAKVGQLLVGHGPGATKGRGTIGTSGEPTAIKKVSLLTAAVSITPGAVLTQTSYTTTVSIPGIRAGDLVFAVPPAALEAGYVIGQPYVSAADTITVVVSNPTALTITGAARNWNFLWVQLV